LKTPSTAAEGTTLPAEGTTPRTTAVEGTTPRTTAVEDTATTDVAMDGAALQQPRLPPLLRLRQQPKHKTDQLKYI